MADVRKEKRTKFHEQAARTIPADRFVSRNGVYGAAELVYSHPKSGVFLLAHYTQ